MEVHMLHNVEEIVAKIKILDEKATLLHNSQYQLSDVEIRYMLEDIQALARDISCDNQESKQ